MKKAVWFLCPVCGKPILKYRQDTVLKNFPAYCRQCRKEILISLEPVSQ